MFFLELICLFGSSVRSLHGDEGNIKSSSLGLPKKFKDLKNKLKKGKLDSFSPIKDKFSKKVDKISGDDIKDKMSKKLGEFPDGDIKDKFSKKFGKKIPDGGIADLDISKSTMAKQEAIEKLKKAEEQKEEALEALKSPMKFGTSKFASKFGSKD